MAPATAGGHCRSRLGPGVGQPPTRQAVAGASSADTLTSTVPIAVIELDFDPILRLGEFAVRLETVGIAAAVLAGLLLAATLAGVTAEEGPDPGPFVYARRLRRDDLLYIAVGLLPGAVIGGRIGYALLHADYYVTNPAALIDPSEGGLELVGAVAGAALAGGAIARLLGGPIGRWYHVAALPALLAIALGKAAGALGGSGQGLPADLPWATAYVADGPWGSLAAAVPSHPAQLYEAALAGAVFLVLAAVMAAGGFRGRDGRAFLVGLGAWSIGRSVVAGTWRDDPIAGPLSAGQMVAVAFAVVALALALVRPRLPAPRVGRTASEPAWPDPETRPRF